MEEAYDRVTVYSRIMDGSRVGEKSLETIHAEDNWNSASSTFTRRKPTRRTRVLYAGWRYRALPRRVPRGVLMW